MALGIYSFEKCDRFAEWEKSGHSFCSVSFNSSVDYNSHFIDCFED